MERIFQDMFTLMGLIVGLVLIIALFKEVTKNDKI